jgi:multidrug efflux system outer membrane protein
MRIAAALLGSLLLSGCSLIPDYVRPGLPVDPAYPAAPAETGNPARPTADQIGWREFFQDPALQRLIEAALRNNRDLRVAALNVAAAQAQFRSQRADLFPHIDLSGSGAFGALPASTSIPVGTAGGAGGAAAGTAASGGVSAANTTAALEQTGSQHVNYRYFTGGLGFTSYELDVFGRIRSLSQQALEQALGYDETRISTQISLVAQVASTYLTVLADRELLRITQQTVDSTSRSLEITRQAAAGGTNTLLSVRQAETVVETARANLGLYTRQLQQDENALVLLLGQPIPTDLPPGRGLYDQGLLADIPAGLPSDLLIRRPDIRAAEHNLLAANANIGAARAAFFPSITLTASNGVANSQLSRLFTGGATTWSFAPQINIPIFTAGQNQANLDLAKLQTNIQVANYEKTIQTAFREVADALSGRATYVEQVRAQERLVAASADSVRLSQMRFQAGVDTFLPVLDAQRTLYSAQQTLLQLRQAQVTNLVTLYKALGGGWTDVVGAPVAYGQPGVAASR